MGWIKNRILAEKRKHEKSGLDWARLTEGKILMTINENNKIGNPILVVLESPFAGDKERNLQYARECMRDCFSRGEFPFVSHLLYTQDGILNDDLPKERELGIDAGLRWGEFAEKTVVYTDLGITEGMKQGITRAKEVGKKIEFRKIKGNK